MVSIEIVKAINRTLVWILNSASIILNLTPSVAFIPQGQVNWSMRALKTFIQTVQWSSMTYSVGVGIVLNACKEGA